LLAAALALAAWVAGFCCRRRGGEEFARPSFVGSLVLTLAALPVSLGSPAGMLLLALLCLLLVLPFPASGWLYAAVGAVAWAVRLAFLPPMPDARWVIVSLLAAYALWALGFLVRRSKPALCARLGVPALDYEAPLFQAAAAAGGLALLIRLGGSLFNGEPWNAHLLLLPVLALLCLLMLRVDPRRAWAHSALALLTAALLFTVSRALIWTVENGEMSLSWLAVGMAVAHLWLLARRALEGIRESLWNRLGIPGELSKRAVGVWSLGAFALAFALALARVAVTAVDATGLSATASSRASTADWWSLVLVLALAAGYSGLRLRARGGREWPVCLRLALLAALWWLAAPGSPVIPSLLVVEWGYYPLVTAVAALVAVRWLKLPAAGTMLTLTALAFTGFGPGLPTAGTLLLASAAFAQVATLRRRTAEVYVAGVCFTLAAPRLLLGAWFRGAACLATLSGTLASLALLGAAAWLQTTIADSGALPFRLRAARALERVALWAALLAGAAVLLAPGSATPEAVRGLPAAGTLLGVTLVCLILAGRWQAEALVYLGEGALVGAYLLGRAPHGLSPALDAALLMLFGFADLGISQLLERQKLRLYARPTFYASLLMPLIPLGQALARGSLDEASLFVLFSAGSFYGVVCWQTGWKSLGYAAGALYNLFLWLAWIQIGWRLAEAPQFYLIPVGVSAILLAEVNRVEWGRASVNAIRSLGSLTITVATALPMWQLQSFGAWATLLLLSLGGILTGLGLRVQAFLGLGLVGFAFALFYPLGRAGMENPLARWALMLGLGLLLILFVALSERQNFRARVRACYDAVRRWE
jgi:hypothetical protein